MLWGMDISNLPQRLRDAGRNQAELARYLNMDPSSLTKTIKGNRVLKADELRKIEAFFAGEAVDDRADNVEHIATRRRSGPRRIPVYGYAAAGGEDRIAFNGGQVIDWIDPPPLWSGTGELLAARVLGDSMEPRLFSGEMVIAQHGLPPRRDQDCIIEMQDGSALVKTYKGQREAKVFAHQWNPGKEIVIEGASVRALHAVIWRR